MGACGSVASGFPAADSLASAPVDSTAQETAADDDDDEDEDDSGEVLEPGLVAVYRSLDPAQVDATLTRIDAKPAFAIGDASPHPRIPAGPFEVVWTGLLDQTGDAPVRFGGYLGGTVTVHLDGTTVLDASSDRQDEWIEAATPVPCGFGRHEVRIVYRSRAGVPARLQLWWEGDDFSWEPLPSWRLKHGTAGAPASLAADELVSRGRALAAIHGCGRCHASALPAIDDPPPGPSLAGSRDRLDRGWLRSWLADPHRMRPGTPMPAVFSQDRQGEVERWLVADHLGRPAGDPASPAEAGSVREGEKAFLKLGCIACHPTPDAVRDERPLPGQHVLRHVADRLPAQELAAFLAAPHGRYPDGRMPLAVDAESARNLAAFILANTEPPAQPAADAAPPSPAEIEAVARRLHVEGPAGAAVALIREKRCAACHAGLDDAAPPGTLEPVPIRTAAAGPEAGCISGASGPRFALDDESRRALAACVAAAPRERHPSAPDARRRALARAGCQQCHVRDGEGPSTLELLAGQVGDKDLRDVPKQRVPKLTQVVAKFQRPYLTATIRDGVKSPRSTFIMPAFGAETDWILQALAEDDGDLADAPDPVPPEVKDPEFSTQGPALVGAAGYSCVNCHLWKGKHIAEPEPGSAGPELTSVTTRLRRDYFDRWLEGPTRLQPRTPMPQIFRKGQPAALAGVLGGESQRQKDALWAYLSMGDACADPRSLPPTPMPTPAAGQPPLVAQIPLHVKLPEAKVVEAILVMFGTNDAVVYDVGAMSLAHVFTGARLERVPTVRRQFSVVGSPAAAARRGRRGPADGRAAGRLRPARRRRPHPHQRGLSRGDGRHRPDVPAGAGRRPGTRLRDRGLGRAGEPRGGVRVAVSRRRRRHHHLRLRHRQGDDPVAPRGGGAALSRGSGRRRPARRGGDDRRRHEAARLPGAGLPQAEDPARRGSPHAGGHRREPAGRAGLHGLDEAGAAVPDRRSAGHRRRRPVRGRRRRPVPGRLLDGPRRGGDPPPAPPQPHAAGRHRWRRRVRPLRPRGPARAAGRGESRQRLRARPRAVRQLRLHVHQPDEEAVSGLRRRGADGARSTRHAGNAR
jgi:hypothetical protein